MLYMATTLTVQVPDDLMEHFRVMAEGEFRSPEGQVLWLIKTAVSAAERRSRELPFRRNRTGGRTQEEWLRDAQPMLSELRNLYLLAGAPSSRVLARRISERSARTISHTTVSCVLGGKVVASWSAMERIVKALGGDVEHYRALWAESLGYHPVS